MRPELREAIWELRDENGRIFPAALVEAARDPKHPAHKEFDWNDARLAHAARLERAAKLINVVILKVTIEKATFTVKAFVQDPVVLGAHRSSIAMKDDTEAAKESMARYARNVRGDLRKMLELAILWEFGEAHLHAALAAVEALIAELEPPSAPVEKPQVQPTHLELL
jgi:hypothetical protein